MSKTLNTATDAELQEVSSSAELAADAAAAAMLQAETLAAQVASVAASQISEATSDIAEIEQTTNDLENENQWLRTAVTSLQTQMTGLETSLSLIRDQLTAERQTTETIHQEVSQTEAALENLPENVAAVEPGTKSNETAETPEPKEAPRREGKRKRRLRRI